MQICKVIHPIIFLLLLFKQLFHMFSRAYRQPCDKDIESLQSCQLLEECEQDLKSLKNYKESIEHVFSKYSNVNNYLEGNPPFSADWPGWCYSQKLIANNSTEKYLTNTRTRPTPCCLKCCAGYCNYL